MDTEILVKRARQGDQEALVQLIMARKQDFYKLAYVYMRNKEDALDAMDEMIVIVYENIHRLKKGEAFYSWSKTILVNCCKKLLREKSKVLSLNILPEKKDEGQFDRKEDQIVLEQHLSKLNAKHRDVLKLRYFLDLEYQTIAEILKIPVGTVKSRIFEGLKKLKESIGGEEVERSGKDI